MEIHEVKLINWTSHRESTITFSKGPNIIVGPIGAGKSSIFDAIAYALFGKIPLHSRVEEVIRKGQQWAKVELTFSHKGHSYRVVRMIEKGGKGIKATARLWKDNQFYADKPTVVSREIERALEVDYHSFVRAIYAPQNEIELFLELPPKERKKAIDDMLNIERFQRYVDELKRVANLYRKELTLLSQEVKKGEGLEGELAELEEELEKAQEGLTTLQQGLPSMERELEEKEGELRKFKAVEERRRALMGRIERLRGEIEALRDITLEPEEPLRERLQQLEKELEKLEGERRTRREQLLEAKRREALREKMLEEQRKARERLKAIEEKLSKAIEVAPLEEKVRKLRAILAKIEERKGELQERLEGLKGASSTCPVCGRPLSEEHRQRLLEETRQHLEELKEKEAKARALLQRAELELGKAREKEREMARLEGERKRLLELLAQPIPQALDAAPLEKALREVEEKLRTLERERAKVRTELAHLLEKKRKVEKRAALEKELEKLEGELKVLPPVEGLEELERRVRALRERVATLRERTKGLEEKVSLLKERMARVERELRERRERERRLARVEALLGDLQLMGSVIEGIQLSLRQEVVVAINEALATLWPLLYPYKDYTALKLEVEEKGYELYLYSDRWERVNAVASGGERAIAALTLRVALAMAVAPHIGLLILDEPTHNLDERAVEALKESLRDELPSIVGQFFIITHDERLAEIGGRVIRVERRKEGLDEAVVRVEG